ncbi:MAG TPA: glycosyltransferase family 4 protein [Candidatus Eisenbergiella merdipullorum]|uniref:Glycosyltransferase family 4 protein n=1 Tax=Candidatus Eisenbergiella merdipullorum TaxID=2838553 RepID=A0A9D2L0X0_9FIRM|nr:glycosyltransferase family 4 protein [Candidatus Eisenbergiella merdipullorum]
MRILWLLNICPPAVGKAFGLSCSVREGWITGALNRFLSDSGETDASMELGICFPVKTVPEEESLSGVRRLHALAEEEKGTGREVSLYGFMEDLNRPELYDKRLEKRFAEILADFQPDLVHIFGTEFPHALAMTHAFQSPERTLVGIQGLMGECAKNYMADLPRSVQRSVTLRDFLRKDSLRQQQEKFYVRAEREREVLLSCAHVTGRTRFDREGTLACNPALIYHKMNETMRSCFYEGSWSRDACRSFEIFASQGDYPLKGFHYLLQAMQEILQEFPQAHISVAGISITGYGTLKEKLKISGYGKYLRKLMKENGLEGKVSVLGNLSDVQMKSAYLNSHVFVCPSALENSPNSLGEAMLLGVPCVASRTGGIPDIAEDGESALFFERGNVHELALCIRRIFRDDALAQTLSQEARIRGRQNHDGDANYRRLLEIYREILA